jgi:YEATS domain-containing protein 4
MCLSLLAQYLFGKEKELMTSTLISMLIQSNPNRWSCYVRGLDNNEDISYYIKKVVFQLHPSFPEPVKSKNY